MTSALARFILTTTGLVFRDTMRSSCRPVSAPARRLALRYQVPTDLLVVAFLLAVVVIEVVTEVEHVEQVPDRRHVGRDIGIEPVPPRIRQVVAAAAGELAETPVALHELHEGRVLVVDVGHAAA